MAIRELMAGWHKNSEIINRGRMRDAIEGGFLFLFMGNGESMINGEDIMGWIMGSL